MRISVLKNGDWEAKIAWDNAMNVFFLTHHGTHILRTPEDPALLEKSAFTFGTPLLFPPSRTLGDAFAFNGVRYTLPYAPKEGGRHNLHGLLYNAPMTVLEESGTRAAGTFLSNESRYPFPFRFTITVSLDAGGLHQSFAVTNTGEADMPFAFGLHTTFVERDCIKVSAGAAWKKQEDLIPLRLTALTAEQEQYRTGLNPRGKRLHDDLHDNGEHTAYVGNTVYKLSPNFKEWVVWNLDGQQGFVSLEPQSGPGNALNMTGQYLVLRPGETETFETYIGIRPET